MKKIIFFSLLIFGVNQISADYIYHSCVRKRCNGMSQPALQHCRKACQLHIGPKN
jgi:hypothetical protein